LVWYEKGLEVDPNHAELHRNLGVIHLLMGNYEIGWQEYRWRWRMPGMHRPLSTAPIWKGESLQGKTILLYPEQGLGDSIQFIRVASALKQQQARVLVQCTDRMLALFTSAPNVNLLVREGSVPPAIDYHASMIEVVDVLYGQTGKMEWGTEHFSSHHGHATTGYLTVSDALIAYWKR
jgi:hypothetical protein